MTGCGNKSAAESADIVYDAGNHDSEEIPSDKTLDANNASGTTATDSIPNEEQMSSDLLNSGANIFSLNNQDEYLDIEQLEVLRRKTNSDYDEVYVSVSLSNEQYVVEAEYTLYYSYYDVGGWVLDTYSLTSHQSGVTGPLLDDAALINYCSQFFSSAEIVDRTYGIDTSGIYQDNISLYTTQESTYITEIYSCYINLSFYDDYWHETCNIDLYDVDWSRLIETWQFTHYDEYVELTITDIFFTDSNYITVAYDYKTSPWHDDGPWYGYYGSAYWTSGSSREESGQTAQLLLSRGDLIFDGVSYPHITAIQNGMHVGLGGYVDYGACFWIYIDIDQGVYIDKFLENYKKSGCEGIWHNSTEIKAFMQKISS